MTDTSPRRSDCPTNYALEHFGDRWTLLIIREMLYFGKTHYGDFLSGEEGIATNTLATRLKKMEDDGLISAGQDRDARRVRYTLTDKGQRQLQHQATEWTQYVECIRQLLGPALAAPKPA